MKTLRMWADKNNVVVSRHAHARCVRADAPNQSDLFRLDDYRVSSVAAGTVWLVRREPFTTEEKTIRGHARNGCVGLTSIQLDSMLQDYTEKASRYRNMEFTRDCVEEFLMEVEAEERDTFNAPSLQDSPALR